MPERDPSKIIVISGVGGVTPLGNNIPETWANLLQGVSGVKRITHSRYGDVSGLRTQIAGQAVNFDESDFFAEKKQARRAHRSAHISLQGAGEAILDAGYHLEPIEIEIPTENGSRKVKRLHIVELNSKEWGGILGTCAAGSVRIADVAEGIRTKGPDRADPLGPSHFLVDRVGDIVSIELNGKGRFVSPVGACASGGLSIAIAAEMLLSGRTRAKMMLAGAADAPIAPITLAAFGVLRVLSTRNDEPEKASSPFTYDADGFVVAEGSGVVVLETLENARRRGVKPYAEVAGWGWNSDSYHETAPDPTGAGQIACMEEALAMAGLTAQDIDYINAHGTATPLGDKVEGLSSSYVYGYTEANFSSTKSMTGHLLGAAGAVEAIIVALAIRNQVIPPSINSERLIKEVSRLNVVGDSALRTRVRAGASSSFGFGGKNSHLVLREIVD